MKRADFHVHTLVSPCAKSEATVSNYLERCAEEGVTAIGFADHTWDSRVRQSKWYTINSIEDLDRVYSLIPEDRKGVDIYVGCETDINVYGEVGIHPESAEKLDFILIPNSHYHYPEAQFVGIDINDPIFMRKWAIERFMIACNTEYKVPTILCHPFIPHGCKTPEIAEQLMREISDNDYIDCFKEAARKNKPIEIHCSVRHRHWVHDSEGFSVEHVRMTSLARECGCKFTYGSDAHWMNMFTGGIHETMEKFAVHCGITEDKIISVIPRNNKSFK